MFSKYSVVLSSADFLEIQTTLAAEKQRREEATDALAVAQVDLAKTIEESEAKQRELAVVAADLAQAKDRITTLESEMQSLREASNSCVDAHESHMESLRNSCNTLSFEIIELHKKDVEKTAAIDKLQQDLAAAKSQAESEKQSLECELRAEKQEEVSQLQQDLAAEQSARVVAEDRLRAIVKALGEHQ
jgi:DNA repair exonuclease SbcCD ATPase subunit